jgi:hypothetical protein
MKKEKLMICLRQRPRQGKTGTIKALAEILIPNPPKVKEWYVPDFSKAEDYGMPNEISKWSKNISEWPADWDICVAVDVKGKRVGLNSEGDWSDDIKDYLEHLIKKQHCDIIFCASWTRGSTVEVVEAMAKKHGYTLIWTAPYTDGDTWKEKPTPFQKQLNRKKAEHLMDFI